MKLNYKEKTRNGFVINLIYTHEYAFYFVAAQPSWTVLWVENFK